MTIKKIRDNSLAPIIAFDFDDTISIDGKYPIPGKPRKYAKEVLNFLVSVGVKVVIHTCRDNAIQQDLKTVIDDITPMIEWMNDQGIQFSAINKSVQFAPYHYNGRKIYAHMYVDDRGFGWYESEEIMLTVLGKFMSDIIGIDDCDIISYAKNSICHNEEVSEDVTNVIKERIRTWNKNDIL